MFKPGPTPRQQGRYLVVAPGSTLPRICVRTGRHDDLVEIEEDVRVARAVERAVGAWGAKWAYESARLRYYINRRELERLQGWRRTCTRGILAAILALAVGLFVRSELTVTIAFAAVCVGTAAYWMLPTPLSVAAVWGRQIFLLKMPREVIERVLQDQE